MANSLLTFAILLLIALFNPNLTASTSGHVTGSCCGSGHLRGKSGKCNLQNNSDCCMPGKLYL
ncbi:hypothetical protein ACMD2_24769 [Ananas comosus]|uniref:Uncharacterized protein n=1 Tax=Ananas comosus TaxID=4615 RepID=A0A199VL66_ANACO|nr:hypothetical protein ACMD2_24769 [Ananas comosus]